MGEVRCRSSVSSLRKGLPEHNRVVAFAARRCSERDAVVTEAMSDPVTVEPTTTVAELVDRLVARSARAACVLDDGRLAGIVTKTDLGRLADDDDLGALFVRDLQTPSPRTVSVTATIAEAAEIIAREDVHQLPVLGSAGQLVGIVTTQDLERWLVRSGDAAAPAVVGRIRGRAGRTG